MEYLEDYLSEELIDKLEIELKKVYDNEEFAICIMSGLNNDVEALEMLNYLKENNFTSKERYKIILFHCDIEKRRKN